MTNFLSQKYLTKPVLAAFTTYPPSLRKLPASLLPISKKSALQSENRWTACNPKIIYNIPLIA